MKSLVYLVLLGALLAIGTSAQKLQSVSPRWAVYWQEAGVDTKIAEVWWVKNTLEVETKLHYERQFGKDMGTENEAWFVDFLRSGEYRGIYAIPGKAPISKEPGFVSIKPL